MRKITKTQAIERFKQGEIIYSYQRRDGQLSRKINPKRNDVQTILDRDGRKFDFCIGVI